MKIFKKQVIDDDEFYSQKYFFLQARHYKQVKESHNKNILLKWSL